MVRFRRCIGLFDKGDKSNGSAIVSTVRIILCKDVSSAFLGGTTSSTGGEHDILDCLEKTRGSNSFGERSRSFYSRVILRVGSAKGGARAYVNITFRIKGTSASVEGCYFFDRSNGVPRSRCLARRNVPCAVKGLGGLIRTEIRSTSGENHNSIGHICPSGRTCLGAICSIVFNCMRPNHVVAVRGDTVTLHVAGKAKRFVGSCVFPGDGRSAITAVDSRLNTCHRVGRHIRSLRREVGVLSRVDRRGLALRGTETSGVCMRRVLGCVRVRGYGTRLRSGGSSLRSVLGGVGRERRGEGSYLTRGSTCAGRRMRIRTRLGTDSCKRGRGRLGRVRGAVRLLTAGSRR